MQPCAARVWRLRSDREFLFVKTLHDADDRAMRITEGSKPHQHVNRMSFFMAQLHFCFLGFALVQGSTDGTGSATGGTALTVTVQQNIVAAGAANHLVPFVPGEPFSALVPEQDLPVSISHGDADLQAVQHGTENLRILKFRHKRLEAALGYSSAGKGKYFSVFCLAREHKEVKQHELGPNGPVPSNAHHAIENTRCSNQNCA